MKIKLSVAYLYSQLMPRRSFNLVEAINKEKHRFSWDGIGSSYLTH